MTFKPNATYTVAKARRIAMAHRKKACIHWGQNTEDALRILYKAAILPILSYASRVWIDRMPYSKVKRKYHSIYRTVSRVLAQGYVSVSTEAAGVIAGILLTDLEIERSLCISELKKRRNAIFQGELITPGQFDTIGHAREYLRWKAEVIWQRRWEETSKGRITYEICPNVNTDAALRPKIFFIRTQVLTGHGNFGCHLKRIGKAETEDCDTCLGRRDDPKHRYLLCPKYNGVRNAIKMELQRWPPALTKIPHLTDEQIFLQLSVSNPT